MSADVQLELKSCQVLRDDTVSVRSKKGFSLASLRTEFFLVPFLVVFQRHREFILSCANTGSRLYVVLEGRLMQRSYVSKHYSIRTPQSQTTLTFKAPIHLENWSRCQSGYAHPCGKQDEFLTRIRYYWVNYEDPSRPNFDVNAREFSRLAWATIY